MSLRHLSPRGRFWLDVFQPDHSILARPASVGLSPTLFFVPRYERTVLKTTDVRPVPHRQTQWVTFNYRWLDAHGAEHRQKTQFEGTYNFPREQQLLLERNGLRIDQGTIYVTASPCWGCFRLVANAGLVKVVFGEFYRDPKIFEISQRLGIETAQIR